MDGTLDALLEKAVGQVKQLLQVHKIGKEQVALEKLAESKSLTIFTRRGFTESIKEQQDLIDEKKKEHIKLISDCDTEEDLEAIETESALIKEDIRRAIQEKKRLHSSIKMLDTTLEDITRMETSHKTFSTVIMADDSLKMARPALNLTYKDMQKFETRVLDMKADRAEDRRADKKVARASKTREQRQADAFAADVGEAPSQLVEDYRKLKMKKSASDARLNQQAEPAALVLPARSEQQTRVEKTEKALTTAQGRSPPPFSDIEIEKVPQRSVRPHNPSSRHSSSREDNPAETKISPRSGSVAAAKAANAQQQQARPMLAPAMVTEAPRPKQPPLRVREATFSIDSLPT
jgi:hypothetical protein